MARIFIGLALYQGAAHIAAQLSSIAAQDYGDWRLVVSDDGSSDAGPQIVRDFAASLPEGQVELVEGPRRGATRNFLSLIGRARPDEYVALSDQDDVWKPGKLSRAMAALTARPDAGLYSACTTICDEDLNPLTGSKRFAGPFDFRNALVQALTAGNTCVLTPEGAAIARAGAPAADAAGIEAHDWWLYQIVSGAGLAILRDDEEVLFYRQHGDNLKGRNDTIAAMKSRLGQLFDGDYGGWLVANVVALRGAAGLLTPENRGVLKAFDGALSKSGWQQVRAFRRLGIRRQTLAASAALYAAALAGRLGRR